MQAIVYDDAFRGIHHEQSMRNLGVVAINRPTPRPRPTRTNGPGATSRSGPGPTDHPRVTAPHAGRQRGNAHDSRLDNAGQLHLSDPLRRVQVRRYPPAAGTAGRSPSASKSPARADRSPRGSAATHPRPTAVTGDPTSSASSTPPTRTSSSSTASARTASINAAYKRTLPADRAAARGWRRQPRRCSGTCPTTGGRVGTSRRVCSTRLHGRCSVAPACGRSTVPPRSPRLTVEHDCQQRRCFEE